MIKKNHYIRLYIGGIIASAFLLSNCISEYQAKGVEQVKDILVVEGTITEGETVIKLSRSIGLLEDFTDNIYITNATVYIECSDGSKSDLGIYGEKGEYTIESGTFDKDKQYRLYIRADGKEYASEYLSPLFTPEIDKLEPVKEDTGHPVYICVDTSDPLNQSRYYRWSYRENWEVWASYEANIGTEWINGVPQTVYYDIQTPNNITYCWGSGKSTTLILGSTEKLSENSVIGKRIHTIDPTDYRLSVLYYVYVEQTQIRKEAYDYFYNLQKNIEQGAGIFSGMPSEMRGNIQCLTDPETYVIGYVEVATITSRERYVYSREGFYESGGSNCQTTDDGEEAAEKGYILYYLEPGIASYALPDCVDCRKRGGNKNKPDFWPTNRL